MVAAGWGSEGVDETQERRLIARWQAGERDALEALFHTHCDRAYGLAHRLTGSHADADDVLQDAWLRAVRGLSQFDGRARFGTWFYSILLRVAADHARRRRRRAAVESLTEAPEAQAPAAGADPSERAAAGELKDALQQAIRALPVKQRAALVLVAFEGMSYAEAAKVMDCSDGTLAWRVAEARRRLADKLAPYLDKAGGADHAM